MRCTEKQFFPEELWQDLDPTMTENDVKNVIERDNQEREKKKNAFQLPGDENANDADLANQSGDEGDDKPARNPDEDDPLMEEEVDDNYDDDDEDGGDYNAEQYFDDGGEDYGDGDDGGDDGGYYE